jgi:hypothetical protein
VRSRPLAPQQIVKTEGKLAERVITQADGLPRTVRASRVQVIHTPQNGAQRVVSDEQLLALFEGRPIALVAVGPGVKRLLFLDPNDEAMFLGPVSNPASEPQ